MNIRFTPIFGYMACFCRFLIGALSLLFLGSSLQLQAGDNLDLSHRRNALTIVIKDSDGSPVQGAAVQVEMINPRFRFGCGANIFNFVRDPYLPRESDDNWHAPYDEKMVEIVQKYFNSITPGNRLKWAFFEDYEIREKYAGKQILETAVNATRALRAFNSSQPMRIRGHATLWGNEYSIPRDVREAGDVGYVKDRLYQHITHYHRHFAGLVPDFDLLNEPGNELWITNRILPEASREELCVEYAKWFRLARESDPQGLLFLNEYNVLNDWNGDDRRVHDYKNLVDGIRDLGGPIDVIGVQAHIDRYVDEATFYRRLDILASPMAPTENHPRGLPGLPIEVTELDVGENNQTGNHWFGEGPSPSREVQAEIMGNLLRAAYTHPAVRGITVWGIQDSRHWRGNGILFDDSDPENWILKPKGKVWVDLVMNKWWTQESGESDPAGEFSCTGFKGTHEVSVTFCDGTTVKRPVEIGDEPTTLYFKYHK